MTSIKKANLTVLALGALFASFSGLAYDPYEISHAAGMYLTATDLHLRLSNSQCGYLMKKSAPNFEVRLQEVLSYLTPSDKIEFEAMVRSTEFKNKLEKNKYLINGSYDAFLKEGVDSKTACGLVWGSLSQAISKGETTWKNVNKNR